MKTVIRGALAAAFLSAASVSGQAADLPYTKAPPPPPVFLDTYQPFQIRLKVAGVVPLDGTSSIYDAGSYYPALFPTPAGGSVGLATLLSGGPGSLVPRASTSTSWSVVPMLDVAYYITKNWAIEAICCVTPHNVQGTGLLAGSDVAHTWLFPPSLLVQYHFTNFGAFQPYLGVGVNFTTFWGTRAGNNNWGLGFVPGSILGGLTGAVASFTSASITPSWGVVGQAGVDYMLNEHWGVNLDVKYIQMETHSHDQIVAFTPGAPGLGAIYIPVSSNTKINPLIISAGLTFRFGGGVVAPILAKY